MGDGWWSLPEGIAALVRSHVALARSIWLIARGETPFLGMMSAVDSIVFVGAARIAAGESARKRAMVFVKIILKDDLGLNVTAW